MKLIHYLFIKHLFMCCMLVHHIEFIFKFNKPVSIKKLSYNSVFVAAALIKKLILKKIHLLWWFRLCHSFISCFIFLNHLLRTLNFKRFRQFNIRHNISYNRCFLHFNCNRLWYRNFCYKFL